MATTPVKRLYLIITVDTETSDSPKARARNGLLPLMVYGELKGEYWGFPKMIEICDRHHCKATFFVSALQYAKDGESVLKEVSRDIKHKGHDVQLHTHPIWGYGKRFMHDYSLEEQIRIIGEGVELLEKWTGESPIGHRAGVYSINEDTIRALSVNGIAVDSSMFYSFYNCQFVKTKNRVIEAKGIIELPVTICQMQHEFTLGPFRYRRPSYYFKTDVDWLSLDELLWFLEQAKANNLRVMNLFLHSYSFLKFNSSFNHFKPDHKDVEKFDKFLSIATKDPEIEVITVKQFYDLYRRNPKIFAEGSDFVPHLTKRIGLRLAVAEGFNLLKAEIVK
jgi:hypothetical protein